jgi:uncharacterized protein involved in response to NO
MIAQDIVRTRDFPKERRIGLYGRRRKIPCTDKKLARAGVIYATFGLNLALSKEFGMFIRDPNAPPPKGFALFNLGFRPFFFGAGLWAVLAMALWGLAFAALIPASVASIAWHGHEMLFGYALAVIAGFLLTAARNWSGVRTPQGWALAGLFALWLIPRVFLPWASPAMLPWLALADVGLDVFLAAILALALWRHPPNLYIFPPLFLLLAVANAAWWLAAIGLWPQGHALGLTLGQGAVLGVLLIMGVRVAPFFIEKRLNVPITARVSVWVYRIGAALYGLLVLAELLGAPWLQAFMAAALAALSAWVLWRWYAPGLWREPLLWVLWLAGGWLVLGLVLKALGDPGSVARHALLVGGVGLASLGMMARVGLGHCGYVVYPAPRGTVLAFVLLLLAALLRVVPPLVAPASLTWAVPLAALLWVLAFALFLAVYAPMLWRPRVDGKPG